jgi:hypothetical protein
MKQKYYVQALRENNNSYDLILTTGSTTIDDNKIIRGVPRNIIRTMFREDDIDYLMKNPTNGGERFRPLLDWEYRDLLKYRDS